MELKGASVWLSGIFRSSNSTISTCGDDWIVTSKSTASASRKAAFRGNLSTKKLVDCAMTHDRRAKSKNDTKSDDRDFMVTVGAFAINTFPRNGCDSMMSLKLLHTDDVAQTTTIR